MRAEGEMLDNSFFITAERPQMGLMVTVVCGLTNMVLDALFMAVFSWGLVGAAAATAISEMLGGFCLCNIYKELPGFIKRPVC